MSEIVETTENELDHYRSWIGRRTTLHDNVSIDVIARFAAAVDRPMPEDGFVPAMWHYGLFLNEVPSAQLGPDGHPPRGGFMPPVRLPRRMFAGSEVHFIAPLRIGMPATCRSEIVSVDLRKSGRGDLILVRVADEVGQDGSVCIRETRTIVYLNAGAAVPPVVPDSIRPRGTDDETWQPDSVALFRFSAVTFNAHRIHYDRPYAQDVELYPDLVVHGPFTAIRLCDFASRYKNTRLQTFSFRGEAPLFCGQPVTLTAIEDGISLLVAAVRCDGKTAMSASATV
jgi:3-methylfumaryl-CoA hydratase